MIQRQMDIQNALRILSHVLPKGSVIIFEGGDLITIDRRDHKTTMGRTQDVAEVIFQEQEKENGILP